MKFKAILNFWGFEKIILLGRPVPEIKIIPEINEAFDVIDEGYPDQGQQLFDEDIKKPLIFKFSHSSDNGNTLHYTIDLFKTDIYRDHTFLVKMYV